MSTSQARECSSPQQQQQQQQQKRWPFPAQPMDPSFLHELPSPGYGPPNAGGGLLPMPQRSPSPGMFSPHSPNLLHPGGMVPGFVSPAVGPADYSQFYAANLQKVSGFVSPAIMPSPTARMSYAQSPMHQPAKSTDEPRTGATTDDMTPPADQVAANYRDVSSRWMYSVPGGEPNNLRRQDDEFMGVMYQAKSLTDQLLREMSVDKAVELLQSALSLLGHSGGGDNGSPAAGGDDGATAPSSLPSVKLVHPDDFKNPSTFLKIYGDPLCFAKTGPLPKKDRNGNWECSKCNNVNFPRRFRCNLCQATRDAEGDWVVSEYAKQVYEGYLYLYRNQLKNGNDISIPVPDVPRPDNDNNNNNNNKRTNKNGSSNRYKGGGGGGNKQQQQQQQRQHHQRQPSPAGSDEKQQSISKVPAKGFQSAIY